MNMVFEFLFKYVITCLFKKVNICTKKYEQLGVEKRIYG